MTELEAERLANRLNAECRDKLRVSYVHRQSSTGWWVEKYGPGKNEWKILREGES